MLFGLFFDRFNKKVDVFYYLFDAATADITLSFKKLTVKYRWSKIAFDFVNFIWGNCVPFLLEESHHFIVLTQAAGVFVLSFLDHAVHYENWMLVTVLFLFYVLTWIILKKTIKFKASFLGVSLPHIPLSTNKSMNTFGELKWT